MNLERTQRGTIDITPWMEWYLSCLGRAIDAAAGTLATTLRKAHVWERANRFPINPRQRQILNRLLDGFVGKLTTSKYAKLAKCSEDTACATSAVLLNTACCTKTTPADAAPATL